MSHPIGSKCSPSNANQPNQYAREIHPSPLFYYGSGELFAYATVPLTVYEIMSSGFMHLSDMPGLSGMYSDVAEDPEVKAILDAMQFG